jgi:hypothetical protein
MVFWDNPGAAISAARTAIRDVLGESGQQEADDTPRIPRRRP